METAVTPLPSTDGRPALPIAKKPRPRPRSVIGATNTLASRTIVTQSDPNASSREAGLGLHGLGVHPRRQQARRLQALSQRARAGARQRDEAVEFSREFDEPGPGVLGRRVIGQGGAVSASTSRSYPPDAGGRSTVDATRAPANRGLAVQQPGQQCAERDRAAQLCGVAFVQFIAQREHRREIHERQHFVDVALAWKGNNGAAPWNG